MVMCETQYPPEFIVVIQVSPKMTRQDSAACVSLSSNNNVKEPSQQNLTAIPSRSRRTKTKLAPGFPAALCVQSVSLLPRRARSTQCLATRME